MRASQATWKVIACDMPLGLVVADGPTDFEAVANGDGGRAARAASWRSRTCSLHPRAGVRNVVWITGDVHYAAAHHYDPARARFKDFKPFWEFVAGPLHAGTFGPGTLDDDLRPRGPLRGASPRA